MFTYWGNIQKYAKTPGLAQPVPGDRLLVGDTIGFSYCVHWSATSKDGRIFCKT